MKKPSDRRQSRNDRPSNETTSVRSPVASAWTRPSFTEQSACAEIGAYAWTA